MNPTSNFAHESTRLSLLLSIWHLGNAAASCKDEAVVALIMEARKHIETALAGLETAMEVERV